MALYKRGKKWHTIVVVNGVYYRESLGTTDKRQAVALERERVKLLEKRAPDLKKRSKSYGSMIIKTAMAAYVAERRHEVSARMVAYWQEQEVSLSAHFKAMKLKHITTAHISYYQRERLEDGKAPKTINNAVSVLRQLLTHARLWYAIKEDYKPLQNNKRPVGRALSIEEQKKLFDTAALWKAEAPSLVKVGKDGKAYKLRADWQYVHAAATLAAYCGL